MNVRPGSQNARILRALGNGRWTAVSEIHRRAGSSRLNSRISELRKKGFVIEHRMRSGWSGGLGHQYRLTNPPSKEELERLAPEKPAALLKRDEVPRDKTHRYRIYRQVYDEIDLVATATTAEDVGVAIITLGAEGAFTGSCVGILDTEGTTAKQGTWILNPWDVTP